jgi:hypothetical protein
MNIGSSQHRIITYHHPTAMPQTPFIPPIILLFVLAQRPDSPFYLPRLLASASSNRHDTNGMTGNADARIDAIDPQIIATNPALAGMGPQVREMMRSPMMREMM